MWLLFIYLFNLYIRPQDWLGVFMALPVDYLIIIPAMVFGLLVQSQDKKMLVRLPQYLIMAVLLMVIFLSNAVNDQIGFGLFEVIKYLKVMCIFILVLLLAKSTQKLKWTMFIIVCCSAFIAMQAISQFISGGLGAAGQGFYLSGVGTRTTWVGLWNGANMTALLLNCSVPFAMEFAFGPYKRLLKILNFIFAACLVGGVYTTNSRGGFLTLLVILFLYPLFKIGKKRTAIIAGILLAGAMLVYLAPSRSGSMMDTSEESAHIRTRLWGNAKDVFRTNPILGVGKGQFINHPENIRSMMTHSNFMQNLCETGIVGIFFWVSLLYFSFKGLFRVYKIEPNNKNEELIKSLSRALLVSFLGFNFGTLFVTHEIDLFYLLLGLCAACVNSFNREVKPVKMMQFTFKDFLAICGIIIGLLGFYQYYTR